MAEIARNLEALAQHWVGARAGERANLQLYLVELCDALMVGRPQPRGTGYEFELQIDAITVEGAESANFIDCWKAGHFALEGKDQDVSKKGKASNEALLRRAYGQVRNYVHHVAGASPPPYLMVLDVGATMIVWDRWAGTFGGFEAGHRIDLPTLHQRPDDIALLRDIWENPSKRDRRGVAAAVTTDIADKLAKLAKALEDRGHDQELVARFLMRVVFSCFAEDVGLLPAESFRETITEAGLKGSPQEFTEAVEGLWRHMDVGGRVGPFRFLKFNGHFFKDATALPLMRPELVMLEAAARADWSEVEPSIFGTLLTRALDPEERHRLGAEFTPRAFIERLIRPTIEEPVLERWTAVQAEVLQLTETGKAKDRTAAETRLRAFHGWMRRLRVLDPACGSGNFLYVAMHALKRIEFEVIRSIERVSGHPDLRLEEIGPAQFYGLEVKPWAREIAELTLWIGFHQFWRQHHDVQPPEPILQDTGTLECRDAVLKWEAQRTLHDDAAARGRAGGPRPVREGGRAYQEYVKAAAADWPAADFIVGNPPYLGKPKQRLELGDGYVDALRGAYPALPDTADLVTYWWYRAAKEVAEGRTIRAGLITTQSLTQAQNRVVITAARKLGASIVWAIPDHAWCDGAEGAEVRVAMTVIAQESGQARLVEVDPVRYLTGSLPPAVIRELVVARLNDDLTVHADVSTSAQIPLLANTGVCATGMTLVGQGFVLPEHEALALLRSEPTVALVVKPYRKGKDLTGRGGDSYIIDFGVMTEREARQFPVPFDIVRNRVKPDRDTNPREGRRRKWWLLGEPNPVLRLALMGLPRYIGTTYTSKHRFFAFLDSTIIPDLGVVAIALDDAFALGVLSSSIHEVWARAAGGKLEDKGRYNKRWCFDPFPFPIPPDATRIMVIGCVERILRHRAMALAATTATMTDLYNIVGLLRAAVPLSVAQRQWYEGAACGVLRDLHDELDALVAEAYGWAWPEPRPIVLERLVALHDHRILEEQGGLVRWLRPAFQQQQLKQETIEPEIAELGIEDAATPSPTTAFAPAWPPDAIGQITVLRTLAAAAPVSVDEAVLLFTSARRDIVTRHFETLALLGEVMTDAAGRYRLAPGALTAV